MKSSETLSSVFDSEISNQIKLAKSNPRILKDCIKEIEYLSQMDLETAMSCFYIIFDKDKPVMGVSVRFAEIVVSSWGNLRAGSRVVSENDKHISVQGYLYDLEKNIFINTEVLEPVIDYNGRKLAKDIMLARINAASSIAFRNAVFKAIPSAVLNNTMKALKKFIKDSTGAEELEKAKMYFYERNITEEMLLTKLKLTTFVNITHETIFLLIGMRNAVKEGDTTIDNLFSKVKKRKTKFERAFDLEEEKKNTEETVVQVKKRGRPPKKATSVA
tara:strand:- start:6737 stop:7558 length:822 start_codon:yes stop_codon:yes gene_type:complete